MLCLLLKLATAGLLQLDEKAGVIMKTTYNKPLFFQFAMNQFGVLLLYVSQAKCLNFGDAVNLLRSIIPQYSLKASPKHVIVKICVFFNITIQDTLK